MVDILDVQTGMFIRFPQSLVASPGCCGELIKDGIGCLGTQLC